MTIAVAGAGAFGTALAIALASASDVLLVGRNRDQMQTLQDNRRHPSRLPGAILPLSVTASSDTSLLANVASVLLCVPAQKLASYLEDHKDALAGKHLIACCKGIDLATLDGPAQTIKSVFPNSLPCVLTGPSFAADIAKGLPTALTLACEDTEVAQHLQTNLSRPNLRVYTTTDVAGAQLGGALKNVIAIAAGTTIGAGLGESARAALIARGFAEMQKLAQALGAQSETLMGLSGIGDLILTCSSEQSRNFSFGMSLGRGQKFDTKITVEGAATAQAACRLAQNLDLELPVTQAVNDLVTGQSDISDVLQNLLSRPPRAE